MSSLSLARVCVGGLATPFQYLSYFIFHFFFIKLYDGAPQSIKLLLLSFAMLTHTRMRAKNKDDIGIFLFINTYSMHVSPFLNAITCKTHSLCAKKSGYILVKPTIVHDNLARPNEYFVANYFDAKVRI